MEARLERAMTRDEYYAWVEEHGHAPTWEPCRLDTRPGTIRQYSNDMPVSRN